MIFTQVLRIAQIKVSMAVTQCGKTTGGEIRPKKGSRPSPQSPKGSSASFLLT